jgi:16S rRNA (guanine527-N7)-methyltransferase
MSQSRLISRLSAAVGRDVSRETFERISCYVALLREEAGRQNLISPSTLDQLWERHIIDCAQLVRFERYNGAGWADIGSGAGLPGVVVACLTEGPVSLIEPRRLRAEFLHKIVERLDLRATVLPMKVERASGRFETITARAVTRLADLLGLSSHLSTRNTVWALPKGKSALMELADARKQWQGVFHVEQSVTDPESRIIVATGVARR